MKVELYAFKVKDYTNILYGQKETHRNCGPCRRCKTCVYYYVQRGDGTKYKYHEYQIEWAQFIGEFEISEGQR